jgi:hypothetical protein
MTRITDWRTSSFSGGENNACVQVANTLEALRDSKNPNGGVVRSNLRHLVNAAKNGQLDR